LTNRFFIITIFHVHQLLKLLKNGRLSKSHPSESTNNGGQHHDDHTLHTRNKLTMAKKGKDKPTGGKSMSRGELRLAKANEVKVLSPSKLLPRSCNAKNVGERSSATPVPKAPTPPPKPKGKGPLLRRKSPLRGNGKSPLKGNGKSPPKKSPPKKSPPKGKESVDEPAPKGKESVDEPAPKGKESVEPAPDQGSPDLGTKNRTLASRNQDMDSTEEETTGYLSSNSSTHRRNARRGCSSRPTSPTEEATLACPPVRNRGGTKKKKTTVLQTSTSLPVDSVQLATALAASASLPSPSSKLPIDHVEDMVKDETDIRDKLQDERFDEDDDPEIEHRHSSEEDSGDAESAGDPQFRPEEEADSGNSDGSVQQYPKTTLHRHHKKRKAVKTKSVPIGKKPRTPQTPRTALSKKKLRSKSPSYVPKGPIDEARDAGEKTLLLAHVRTAFSDIGPSIPPQPPFIYWDPDVTYACAAKIINRYQQLIDMSQKQPYERKNDLAKKWGQVVRTQANNERSTQIRTIKSLWLNNASQLSLTKYDANPRTPAVELADVLQEQTDLETVDDLRALLFSDKMYLNETVFDMFCLGIESGAFKHTEECPPTRISDILTPSHEAHFRAELWWTLPHTQFRHGIGLKHAAQRIKKWHEFLPLVRADRLNNEVDAVLNRTNMYAEHGVVVDVDPEDGGGLDVADTMYWG
jgi:hypothetical protein